MKKILLSILLIIPSLCFSQDYGIKLIYNVASHTNYDPQTPEDGKFQWNDLVGLGVEAWYSYNLYNKFDNNLSIGFQQKGYKEIAQTGLIGPVTTPVSYNTIQNRINVIALV